MQHLSQALASLNLPTQSDLSLAQTRSNLATNPTDGLTAPLVPLDGVSVSVLLRESPMSDSDNDVKQELLARLTASYKLDYFDERSIHCQGAKDLFRRAMNKGWSKREFLERLDKMTEACKFPTWTPADFFQHERGCLHHYEWVIEEMHKNPSAMKNMEAYKVSGHDKPLWRYCNAQGTPIAGLERVVFRNSSSIIALPEPKALEAPLTSEQKETVDFVLQLCESEKRISELEKRISELEKQVEKYKRWWEQSVEEKHSLMKLLAEYDLREAETA